MSEFESKKVSIVKEEQPAGKPPDAAQAREEVKGRVRRAAGDIADELIKVAMSGQLATAKYLFEVAGLYPATEEAEPQENSLAYILLKRLGLPTDPLNEETDSEAGAVERDAMDVVPDGEDVEFSSTVRRIVAVPRAVPGHADIMLEIEGHEC